MAPDATAIVTALTPGVAAFEATGRGRFWVFGDTLAARRDEGDELAAVLLIGIYAY